MRPLTRIAALFTMATAATLVTALPAWAAGPAGPGSLVNGGEGPVFIKAHDATVVEGDEGTVELRFPVTLSKPSQSPIEIEVSTPQLLVLEEATHDAAGKGVDYAGLADQRVFGPGTTKLEVTVKVSGDPVHEGDEVLGLRIEDASGGVVADDFATGTIQDDDPVPTVSIGDVSIIEGTGGPTGMHFTVALSNPSDEKVHVEVVPAAGSATEGVDWHAQAAQLTFDAGQTVDDYVVSVVGDDRPEPQESFTVTTGQVEGAMVAGDAAMGTIDDDDVEDAGGTEGNKDGGSAEGGGSSDGPAVRVGGAGDEREGSFEGPTFSVSAAETPAGAGEDHAAVARPRDGRAASGTARTVLALGLAGTGLALFLVLFAKGRRNRRPVR